jgi:hypothetical protein
MKRVEFTKVITNYKKGDIIRCFIVNRLDEREISVIGQIIYISKFVAILNMRICKLSCPDYFKPYLHIYNHLDDNYEYLQIKFNNIVSIKNFNRSYKIMKITDGFTKI